MPNQWILSIFFFISIIIGCVTAVYSIVSAHKPIQRPGTIFEWQERSLPGWKYEPYNEGITLVHALAIFALCVIALHAISNPESKIFVNVDTTISLLFWFSECGCMAFMGFQLGVMPANPLVELSNTTYTRSITKEGVTAGKILLPWRYFSHFTIHHRDRTLWFYSAYAPDLSSLIMKIPESISLFDLNNTLQQFLPDHPTEDKLTWYRTKQMLIPALLLACFPWVAAGWLVSFLPRILALLALAFLTVLVSSAGRSVIIQYAFGVRGNKRSQIKRAL